MPNDDQQAVLQEVQAMVDTLPQAQRQRVIDAAHKIRVIVDSYHNGDGQIALALIGAELAARSN